MRKHFFRTLLGLFIILGLSANIALAEASLGFTKASILLVDDLSVSEEADPSPAPKPVTYQAKIIKRDGFYYYIDPSNGEIRTKAGFVTYNDKRYYIKKGGKIAANQTITVDGFKYHTNKKGVIYTGVHKWKGKYYYSSYKAGKLRTKAKFVNWNGSRYYIQKGGTLATDKEFVIKGKTYRAQTNAKIKRGAYYWKDNWYFSHVKTGALIKKAGFVKWDGKKYYVQDDGTLASNKGFVLDYKRSYYADKYCRIKKITGEKNNVLVTAQSEVGNMTGAKYWRWYFGTRFIDTDRTPWCATFVAWCYNQAGQYNRITGVRRYGNLGYVPSYVRFANNYGRWVDKQSARSGDLIIFGKSGKHIGIVEQVRGDYVFTIEGNSGPTAAYGCGLPGAVTRKAYRLDDPYIKGVVRP